MSSVYTVQHDMYWSHHRYNVLCAKQNICHITETRGISNMYMGKYTEIINDTLLVTSFNQSEFISKKGQQTKTSIQIFITRCFYQLKV